MQKNRRGQIWVETVIYTLIAFALIGLVLAFARPKIEELQDKGILEQSIEMMESIDSTFTELIRGGSGNKRVLEVGIRKGQLRIDAENDKLVFEMEGGYLYSEPGEKIQQGNLIIESEQKGELSLINVTRDYSNYNLTYQNGDISKIISKANAPYKLTISNEGKDSNNETIINVDLT